MASVTVALTTICGGGNHLVFSVTGARSMTVLGEIASMVDAPMTDEEAAAFVKGMVKLGKVGRTNAQLRTLFQNGVTVTV